MTGQSFSYGTTEMVIVFLFAGAGHSEMGKTNFS